ncbi:MAG TPA: aldo/keto reductase [Dehalococcoidia bacterium]|nr:aldo/keto reductase [Dehalococcoidia bacterium]
MPEFVNLGRSGLLVSRLGLGTFNFGNTTIGVDEETARGIIDAYLGAGHNYIDTANIYGDSRAESIVGRALKGRRDAVVLATKAGGVWGPGPSEGGTSRKALLRAVEDSLRRLDTDYIDLYQMHVFDYRTPLEETLSTLNDLVRRGMVRYFGVSNWTASQITDAVRLTEKHGWEPIASLQPQYNILLRDVETEIVPVCQQFGLGVVPWSPLAGGTLAGIYSRGQAPTQTGRLAAFPNLLSRLNDRQWEVIEIVKNEAAKLGTTPVALSLAWLLRKPGVTAPLMGPENEDQLAQNLAALELDVPAETMERIDAASAPAVGYPHNFGRRR